MTGARSFREGPIADEIKAGSTPAILLPYQQEWVADESEVKLAEKSRRIGLTWAEASDDVLIAARRRDAGGDDVFYIGYNLEMAREFIDACGLWARAFRHAAAAAAEFLFEDQEEDGESHHIKAFRIDFASGHKIVALSSRPRSLRGMQGVVVIDEAAFHDDLAELLKAAMAMLIWGSRVRIISTHDGADNPFAELVEECRAKRLPYAVHRIDFDQAIADGLYRRVCEVNGKTWTPEGEAEWRAKIVAAYHPNEDEELFVIPRQGSGVWLSREAIKACMNPHFIVVYRAFPAGFELKPDHVRASEVDAWLEETVAPLLAQLSPTALSFMGGDFGRSGDLTVMWPGQIGRDGRTLRVPFAVELRNCPFRDQERILNYIGDRLPRLSHVALDARGIGAALAEFAMQRYGAMRVTLVNATIEWYREHMPGLKARFEDRTIEAPLHEDIIADLRLVRLDKGVARVPDNVRTRSVQGGQRHGDAAIAAALLNFAAEQDPVEFGYTPAARARPFDDGASGSDARGWRERADEAPRDDSRFGRGAF